MPLQTSGPISINNLHVEAGGSSNTTVSISDSDVRGLINKGAGATASISEWYGASAMQTITSTATHFISASQYTTPTLQFHNLFGGSSNTNGINIQTTACNNITSGQTQLGPESSNSSWSELVGGVSFNRNYANIRFVQLSQGNTGQTYYLQANNADFARSGDYIEMIYNGTLIVTLNQKAEAANNAAYPLVFYNASMTNSTMLSGRTNPSLWQMKYYY